MKSLKISNFHRREENTPICTLGLEDRTTIQHLLLDTVSTENKTGEVMPLVQLYPESRIETLTLRSVNTNGDPRIVSEGTVDTLRDEDANG